MNSKKLINKCVALLTCCMLALSTCVGYADDNATQVTPVGLDTTAASGSTAVLLTAEEAVIDVTVPTSFLVYVDSAGVVTSATEAYIINKSGGPVDVTNIDVAAQNGYVLEEYDGWNVKSEVINTKKYAMALGVYDLNSSDIASNVWTPTGTNYFSTATIDDTVAFNYAANADGSHPFSLAAEGLAGDQLRLAYTAKVPATSASIDGLTIATVAFTVDWKQ